MPIEAVAALPPLRDIIDQNDLRATKALGQNFLLDLNLTRKIARQADIEDHDHFIEIGPGPGGLTRGLLLEGAPHVTAIEFDSRAVQALQSLKQAAGNALTIINGDALQIDCMTIGDNRHRKIVANLPYNISTPLLIGWLRHIHTYGPGAYTSITIMVQKEVAQRISATYGSKLYGRLGVLSQWLCNCEILFDVPREAFVPPPKVTSSIVQLTPKMRDDKIAFEIIEQLTAAAFGQRRKTIRQSLKPFQHALEKSGLDTNLRAENLSVADFINLAHHAV